jgi:hypothetical protein
MKTKEIMIDISTKSTTYENVTCDQENLDCVYVEETGEWEEELNLWLWLWLWVDGGEILNGVV